MVDRFNDIYECPRCKTKWSLPEGVDEDTKWLLCPKCGTAIMKDEYDERARTIAVFLSTEIRWYDPLERMPDEVSGRFLVLMITGTVLTCDYYKGHWNATEGYLGSAFDNVDVLAWAEIPKELTELARKRWKEVYE